MRKVQDRARSTTIESRTLGEQFLLCNCIVRDCRDKNAFLNVEMILRKVNSHQQYY